jgi:hypothetical protein
MTPHAMQTMQTMQIYVPTRHLSIFAKPDALGSESPGSLKELAYTLYEMAPCDYVGREARIEIFISGSAQALKGKSAREEALCE